MARVLKCFAHLPCSLLCGMCQHSQRHVINSIKAHKTYGQTTNRTATWGTNCKTSKQANAGWAATTTTTLLLSIVVPSAAARSLWVYVSYTFLTGRLSVRENAASRVHLKHIYVNHAHYAHISALNYICMCACVCIVAHIYIYIETDRRVKREKMQKRETWSDHSLGGLTEV